MYAQGLLDAFRFGLQRSRSAVKVRGVRGVWGAMVGTMWRARGWRRPTALKLSQIICLGRMCLQLRRAAETMHGTCTTCISRRARAVKTTLSAHFASARAANALKEGAYSRASIHRRVARAGAQDATQAEGEAGGRSPSCEQDYGRRTCAVSSCVRRRRHTTLSDVLVVSLWRESRCAGGAKRV